MKNEKPKSQDPKTQKSKKTKKVIPNSKIQIPKISKNPLEIHAPNEAEGEVGRANQSEDKIEEIKNNDNRFVVIESYRDNKKGTVVHAIVKSGKFKVGDSVFLGDKNVKIKALINDKGKKIEVAEVGDPVEILGFNEAAEVGVVGSDRKQEVKVEVKIEKVELEVVEETEEVEGAEGIEEKVEEKPPEFKKLLVVLRADNQGSLEAIRASLPPEIQLIFVATGNLTESDVLLAKTTKAIVVGFNVNVFPSVSRLAELEGVMIQTYTVIYKMLEELQEVADSINEVTATEKIIGRAEIVQDFLGTKSRIAGCKIREGKFLIGDKVRVERGEKIIGEAKIESIKSFKKDVQKIVSGEECGIVLIPEVDFRVKDFIISARPIGRP